MLEIVLFPDSLDLCLLAIELVGDVKHLRWRQLLDIHTTHVEVLVSHRVQLLFLLLLPWHPRVARTDDIVVVARLLFVVGRYQIIRCHRGVELLEFRRYILVFRDTPSLQEALQILGGATIAGFTLSRFPILLITCRGRQSFNCLIDLLLGLDLKFCQLLVGQFLYLVAVFLLLAVKFFEELHQVLSIFVLVYRFLLRFVFIFTNKLIIHLLLEGSHFLVNSLSNFPFDHLLNGGMVVLSKVIKTIGLVIVQ